MERKPKKIIPMANGHCKTLANMPNNKITSEILNGVLKIFFAIAMPLFILNYLNIGAKAFHYPKDIIDCFL